MEYWNDGVMKDLNYALVNIPFFQQLICRIGFNYSNFPGVADMVSY